MTVLVDSDILIEISRARNFDLVTKWTEMAESRTSILYCPVSSAELWAGARPPEYRALADLFEALICVPIDAGAGQQAGEYLKRFRKSHGVELADALIATSAVRNQAALWTRNRKHYPMKEITFFEDR